MLEVNAISDIFYFIAKYAGRTIPVDIAEIKEIAKKTADEIVDSYLGECSASIDDGIIKNMGHVITPKIKVFNEEMTVPAPEEPGKRIPVKVRIATMEDSPDPTGLAGKTKEGDFAINVYVGLSAVDSLAREEGADIDLLKDIVRNHIHNIMLHELVHIADPRLRKRLPAVMSNKNPYLDYTVQNTVPYSNKRNEYDKIHNDKTDKPFDYTEFTDQFDEEEISKQEHPFKQSGNPRKPRRIGYLDQPQERLAMLHEIVDQVLEFGKPYLDDTSLSTSQIVEESLKMSDSWYNYSDMMDDNTKNRILKTLVRVVEDERTKN